MKRRIDSGEGETPRDALEALAFALKPDDIEGGRMVIHLEAAKLPPFGRHGEQDGFIAKVIRGVKQ